VQSYWDSEKFYTVAAIGNGPTAVGMMCNCLCGTQRQLCSHQLAVYLRYYPAALGDLLNTLPLKKDRKDKPIEAFKLFSLSSVRGGLKRCQFNRSKLHYRVMCEEGDNHGPTLVFDKEEADWNSQSDSDSDEGLNHGQIEVCVFLAFPKPRGLMSLETG